MATYHGKEAIKRVIKEYGHSITREMLPVIQWEGYSDCVYTDTKGIETCGVGQTGPFLSKSFPETFKAKKAELLALTPQFNRLPEDVQDALLVANYRGDWRLSPQTRALFDAKKYREAAEEYLNNAEYRASTGHIKRRFEYVAQALRDMADEALT